MCPWSFYSCMSKYAVFDELRKLAAELRQPDEQDLDVFGNSIGLFLMEPCAYTPYDATPFNVDTFAHTGGDGVHYSFLKVPSLPPEESPILMTVPMASRPNYVVGASLVEFLALGCRRGYFAIEQLAYDYGDACEYFSSTDPPEPDDERLLTAITDRFGLNPWPDVVMRLTELRDQYIRYAKPRKPEYFE